MGLLNKSPPYVPYEHICLTDMPMRICVNCCKPYSHADEHRDPFCSDVCETNYYGYMPDNKAHISCISCCNEVSKEEAVDDAFCSEECKQAMVESMVA